MRSPSGRYTLVFNGEIYNHRLLRREFRRRPLEFVGHSDTETLAACLDKYGVRETLRRLNGMFAIAVWDSSNRTLHLARDRMGEKPLYFGFAGDAFIFGSELKALREHPNFRADIDRQALSAFLRLGFVPAPWSIYEGIAKLEPGVCLSLDHRTMKVTRAAYWSLDEATADARAAPADATDRLDELDELLRDSVALRLEADVELGAFLSGGVDSALVVALMQHVGSGKTRTFTIGFEDRQYDESTAAASVARYLGTDHTSLTATPAEARALIPSLPTLFDEPFADTSMLPTHLVARLARPHVSVALSGDGGDELFGGYNRYRFVPAVERYTARWPRVLRRGVAGALGGVPWSFSNAAAGVATGRLSEKRLVRNPADKLQKLATVLASDDAMSAYWSLLERWPQSISLVGPDDPGLRLLKAGSLREGGLDDVAYMMLLDTKYYLPDQILAKVDRATMGVSLESRAPLLDHRLLECAWRWPTEARVGATGKAPLRAVLERYVPSALVDRPKMAFTVPIGSWLREDLRPWAESLLDPHRLAAEGYIATQPVGRAWREHVSGMRNHQDRIWAVLMFQAWLERERAANQ